MQVRKLAIGRTNVISPQSVVSEAVRLNTCREIFPHGPV